MGRLCNSLNPNCMKPTRFLLLGAGAILLSGMVFISCKKENNNNKGSASDIEIAESSTVAESDYNDVGILVDQAAITGDVNYRLANGSSTWSQEGSLGSSCASIGIDTVSSTHTVFIDFGTSNCLCNDGRYRRGKILATFTGRYRDQGTVITITFGNYFVNDYQVMGTKTITNQGNNSSGHLVYAIQVDGSIVKPNNGGTSTWSSTRQREWTAGQVTPSWADDEYSITGTASGTTAGGISYTVTINKPLVRKVSCRWFESGSFSVTPQGEPARTLDFGNSGCDANAIFSVVGINIPVVLP